MSLLSLAGIVQQQGAAGTVYVEHDYTATTTGDLSTTDPDIDTVGAGYVGAFGGPAAFDFQSDNSGVQSQEYNLGRPALVDAGEEDVQITLHGTLDFNGGSDHEWGMGLVCRGTAAYGSSLTLEWYGTSTAPNFILVDGIAGGTAQKTWTLSGLTNPPASGDTFELVVQCSGDDIVLYSIKTNSNAVEVIDETYTLTGGTATAHGSGSGKTHYGLDAAGGGPPSPARATYFKVESI